jgi:hypothetical protein
MKPMTTAEMVKYLEEWAEVCSDDESRDFTAIARRLRLLAEVAKTSSRRLTASGFTMVPVGPATPDNPIFVAYRDARAALDADEREGGSE